MIWIYYIQSDVPCWKDNLLIQYFSNNMIDVRVISIKNDDLEQHLRVAGLERVIFSNFTNNSHINQSYMPIYLSELCRKNNIHLTYINQEMYWKDDNLHYVKKLLSMNENTLYLNLWMLVNEDLKSNSENMLLEMMEHVSHFDVNGRYYISNILDVYPILFDLIRQKSSGCFDLANPTAIPFQNIILLFKEYLSTELLLLSDKQPHLYKSHPEIDTSPMESKYFILPSYQSLQRLFKRIRKNSVVRDVSLHQKTSVILVTGGYGFIGSNLVHHLYHKYPKCKIINIDRLDYCSRKENLDDLINSERVVCYDIDLSDTPKVEDILKTHNVQYVFHLAAQSHVDNSFNNSLQFSQDNVYATHSLLEACKNYGKLIRFLHVSTDEIYGETLQLQPFMENELPNPTNPYAATKVGAEYIVRSYYHCFELPVVIVRGNNVYGPRQFPEKMIPKFITAVLNDDPCTIAGNGLMQRNFIFVEDVCHGLVAVLEKGLIDNIYNIGTNDEKSVLDIAKIIINVIKGPNVDLEDYLQYVKDRYYNDFRYSINADKIRSLGWKPKMSFPEGLLKTIQFYTDNVSLYS
jgi:dTDP-glucose 4,6-dehydratase